MDRPGSGLRRLTALLVVLNLAVLAAGWAGSRWLDQGTPPVTFNAAKIQLREDVLPAQEAARQAPAGVSRQAQAAPASACQVWEGLDADGLAQVEAYLRQAGVDEKDYDLVVSTRLGWWVFIPPMESMAALQVVMDDARAKGVKDMSPIRSGQLANALVLGTFPTLEGARRHAADMEKKGVRGVRFSPRPGTGAVRLVALRESTVLQQALSGPWPPGLAPKPCPAMQP